MNDRATAPAQSAPAEPLQDAPFGTGYGPWLCGPYAPVAAELAVELAVLAGEIPTDLRGVYLRNGPNPRFAPQGRYHPFDGDGMLHAAHFDGARVMYRNRYVATDGLGEEVRAGAATHWGIRHTLKGREDLRLKDNANTDVVVHGGFAIASCYTSGALYKLDPQTLEPRGKLAPAGLGEVSAHMKVCSVTGEMFFFDYAAAPPYLRIGALTPAGELGYVTEVPLPGPRLPHDMAITLAHVIVMDLPLFHDPVALAAGRHKLAFYPDMPARFGVVVRGAPGASVRWFEFAACYMYHTVNAWEEGDWLTLIGCRFMPQLKDGRVDAEATTTLVAGLGMDARLWRWRMNLRTGACEEGALNTDLNVEFPGLNLRRLGQKTRYAYVVDHHPRMLRWTGIRKMDCESGASLASYSDGEQVAWYSEPWFAAREYADPTRAACAAEDDGYVIAFCYRTDTDEQQLQVFDARDLEAGPVLRLRVPARVPVGFHATFARPSEYGLSK